MQAIPATEEDTLGWFGYAPLADAPLPAGALRYKLLTGPDDAALCRRVSDALDAGYALAGSPALTFDGTKVVAAQAVVWPGPVATQPDAAPAGAAVPQPAAPAASEPSEGKDPDGTTRVADAPVGQED